MNQSSWLVLSRIFCDVVIASVVVETISHVPSTHFQYIWKRLVDHFCPPIALTTSEALHSCSVPIGWRNPFYSVLCCLSCCCLTVCFYTSDCLLPQTPHIFSSSTFLKKSRSRLDELRTKYFIVLVSLLPVFSCFLGGFFASRALFARYPANDFSTLFMLEPRKLKDPPCWVIIHLFFVSVPVFFANRWIDLLYRRNFYNCCGVNFTLPFSISLIHSETASKFVLPAHWASNLRRIEFLLRASICRKSLLSDILLPPSFMAIMIMPIRNFFDMAQTYLSWT